MSSLTNSLRRRTIAIAIVVVAVAAAALSPATSARQSIVHTRLARAGTIVVSGYDGGVALAPPAKTP